MYAHGMASTMSLHRSWPKKEELAAACTVDNLFRSRRMLGLAAEVVVQEAVQFRCGHRCGLVVVVLEQERRSKCRREFDRTKTRRRCIQSRMRACVREKESGGACVCVFAQLATIMDVRRMRIYRNLCERLWLALTWTKTLWAQAVHMNDSHGCHSIARKEYPTLAITFIKQYVFFDSVRPQARARRSARDRRICQESVVRTKG